MKGRIDELSREVSEAVLHHIDVMYPRMWSSVSKSARTSIRNTIKIEVIKVMTALLEERDENEQDPEGVTNAYKPTDDWAGPNPEGEK